MALRTGTIGQALANDEDVRFLRFGTLTTRSQADLLAGTTRSFHTWMNVRQGSATISGMVSSDWIALGSLFVACISALTAIQSIRFSRRMYSLAVAEQRRTESALELYLADSLVVHRAKDNRRIYLFSLVITNPSLAANSIKEVRLSLECSQPDRPPSNMVVRHDSNVADSVDLGKAEVLRIPGPIAAGGTVSGVAVFPVANVHFGGGAVESYTIIVLDARDRQASCQPILLKEMGDEDT